MYSTVYSLVHSTVYIVMFIRVKSTMFNAAYRRKGKFVWKGISQVSNFYTWYSLCYSTMYTTLYTVHCSFKWHIDMCGVQPLNELWLYSQRKPKGVTTARLWIYPFIRLYWWISEKSNIALARLFYCPKYLVI